MNYDNKKELELLKNSIYLIKNNKINEAEIILFELIKKKEFLLDCLIYIGICKIKKNDSDQAIHYLNKALKINPNNELASLNLGLIYFGKKIFLESIKYLDKVYKNNNKNLVAIYHLGLAYMGINKLEESEKFFETLLKFNPKDEIALLNLGVLNEKKLEHEKSININKELIKINNKNINAYNNIGNSYFNLFNFEEAINYYKKCISINDKYAPAYRNLGILYSELKEFDQSIKYLKFAIDLNKNDFISLFTLSKVYLSNNNYSEGFKLYEYRKQLNNQQNINYLKKNFNSQEWKGEKIKNKTILIVSEQGFGDTIQFSRYLNILKGNKIIFFINKKLNFLFRNSKNLIINKINEIPNHDYYQNLLSLPKFYYEENKSFIKNDNFITNSRTNDELWNSKLKKFNKFKIGLFWQGSKNYVGDIRRSIPLNKFDKIIKNKKINVISLQKGDGTNQIKENKYEKYIIEYSKDLDNTEDAYKDTLSILKNIDLLITSDSSVAHLAGTINKKTWLLLCYNPDWRWYIQNKSNSFYDSIKIFQQNKFGDWDNVFKSVETELELLLNNS